MDMGYNSYTAGKSKATGLGVGALEVGGLISRHSEEADMADNFGNCITGNHDWQQATHTIDKCHKCGALRNEDGYIPEDILKEVGSDYRIEVGLITWVRIGYPSIAPLLYLMPYNIGGRSYQSVYSPTLFGKWKLSKRMRLVHYLDWDGSEDPEHPYCYSLQRRHKNGGWYELRYSAQNKFHQETMHELLKVASSQYPGYLVGMPWGNLIFVAAQKGTFWLAFLSLILSIIALRCQ